MSTDKKKKKEKKKILIVDDESTIRWVLKSALESDDLAVFEAQYGQEGLAMVKELEPDLVIMDYRMPDINGWDVAKEVLKILPGTTIIGHTGYANKENIDKGLQSGCIEILDKPVDLDTWEKTINKYLF